LCNSLWVELRFFEALHLLKILRFAQNDSEVRSGWWGEHFSRGVQIEDDNIILGSASRRVSVSTRFFASLRMTAFYLLLISEKRGGVLDNHDNGCTGHTTLVYDFEKG